MGIIILWNLYYANEEYWFTFVVISVSIFMIQVLLGLFSFWFNEFYYIVSCSPEKDIKIATHALVSPTTNNGWSEIVPIRRTHLNNGKIKTWLDFQKVIYIYDSDKKRFNQLTFDNNRSFSYFNSWTGLTSDEIINETKLKYGDNKMEMAVPSFMELFIERATAPFFVFQVFCVGLWCLEDLVYYSLFTLSMLAMFEMLIVKQQMMNMTMIRNMGNKPFLVDVYRNKKWIKIHSDQLLVGDLISIGRSSNDNNVPCDLLLLRGNCILDESMLTGESVPQMKESIQNLEQERHFNYQTDMKLHVLCGGTKIVQHTNENTKSGNVPKVPGDGVLCYVLQTGFSTSQGSLLRTILFGVKRVTANNLETFAFILFLLIFAIATAIHLWKTRSLEPEFNKFQTLVECSLIITSVVPPELPLELSLAVNNSLVALHKLGIFCTEPFRIPFAGKIDVCCFDKTGTLTTDNLVVDGIGMINEDKSVSLKTKDDLDDITLRVLASCHSLVMFNKELVGDPLEKATLNWIKWDIVKNDLVSPSNGKTSAIKIFQRYHFSSQLKRMTVISGYTPQGSEPVMMTAVKGAPEVLQHMFTTVPEGYVEGYKSLAQKGYRVLALGYSNLGNIDKNNIRHISRDDLERGLTFAGFLVISCPLKKDTKAMIKEIKESGHSVVMITGDNPLTACHVSRELKFTEEGKEIMILQKEDEKWYWKSVDETKKMEMKNNSPNFFNLHELCVTGSGFGHLYNQERKFLGSILKYIKIYARMAPKQKEQVINELKNQGYVTLMCGDGTNDVGALKHSHVGVALLSHPFDATKTNAEDLSVSKPKPVAPPQIPEFLRKRLPPDHPYHKQMNDQQKKFQKLIEDLESEEPSVVKLGDASIAAPFTSKFTSIASICNIIKQGRCTLVVTLQMFKILALNALVSAYSQSVLYSSGIRSSDYQQTLQGMLLAACFLFITRSKPLKTLSREKPMPNIFNLYTILTVSFQFCVHFLCLLYIVDLASIYDPPTEKVTSETKFKPSLLNSSVYLLGMTLQISTFIVNYRGRPFMESLIENKPLLYSIIAATSVVFTLASNAAPDMTNYFELVQFPDDFRNKLIIVLIANIGVCYIIDTILNFIFGDARPKKHRL
ncbi:Cation-transporting P-type ATPase family and Cation-transporting P-type ATPase, subfamily V and P-type ATPase, A domain and HAD-like domain and P-type ATPase, cytoplasmic domain N-containing protein [Strongyloides ratti]|uniref:Cation-transporting P-type ATPase family and Cation-transporting P-type ATPase, subfamily V and P-type ATPase, A domain and HAD-like domain and P-type ATPase, cytoplasmic domain N-containing protein n=1 Tax=Strongyloides ratti TaxID=34506 RepID=A0A090LDI6_STRRB|nr:Cation-transporting P-type ATPase family and Cation-transporting P-type ATPase, subfamily V and P-type ATPase, A domain and HAD-like domain and P-type ATPase, cytoplasmic domain N-containing protein [Strongyloides ratti]CEF67827.1 Cation-transporting P-type ATPase family and Cation-transporting P-type ATPase, subfamily V and P-type ATPase, A domain and HAD-like domain and P-type ATPase, cytoplasmic domain N-containing protein [Strongyloides ratti]